MWKKKKLLWNDCQFEDAKEQIQLKSQVGTLRKAWENYPNKMEKEQEPEVIRETERFYNKGYRHADNWCSWRRKQEPRNKSKDIKEKTFNKKIKEDPNRQF